MAKTGRESRNQKELQDQSAGTTAGQTEVQQVGITAYRFPEVDLQEASEESRASTCQQSPLDGDGAQARAVIVGARSHDTQQ